MSDTKGKTIGETYAMMSDIPEVDSKDMLWASNEGTLERENDTINNIKKEIPQDKY